MSCLHRIGNETDASWCAERLPTLSAERNREAFTAAVRRLSLMVSALTGLAVCSLAPPAEAQFAYTTLNYGTTGTFLTGIRGNNIVGNYVIPSSGQTGGLLYSSSTGIWTPFPVATTNGANFPGAIGSSPYGPSFGSQYGILNAVGSYKIQSSPYNLSYLYNAAAAPAGNLTTLVYPGASTLETIAHSTFGNQVVGNYDTRLATGNAFIYTISTGAYGTNDFPGAVSTTAYGSGATRSPVGILLLGWGSSAAISMMRAPASGRPTTIPVLWSRISKASLGGRSGNIDVDSGRGGVYATWFNRGIYLNGAIYGGHDVYSSSRSSLGGVASGGTGGGEFSTFISGDYDFHLGNLTLGPIGSLQYTYVNIDSFSEKGSLAPLQFPSQSADSLRTDFGLRAFYLWQIGKIMVEPSLRAAWEHEFKYSALPITAGFDGIAGPSATFFGPSEGHDSAIVSAGVSVRWTPTIATYVNYDGRLGRNRYDSNAVTGGVRISF